MKVSERVRELKSFWDNSNTILNELAIDYKKQVKYKGKPSDLYDAVRRAYLEDELSFQEIADQLEACGL